MQKHLMLATLLSATCAITACGGGSSSASIAGVWDNSEDLGSDGFDEVYIAFDSKGSISFYDYAGDTYDHAGNCYWIAKDVGILEKIKGNQYTLVFEDDAVVNTATIDVTKSKLSMTITAPEAQETVTFDRSDKRVSDFKPECADSVGSSQGPDIKSKLQKKLAK